MTRTFTAGVSLIALAFTLGLHGAANAQAAPPDGPATKAAKGKEPAQPEVVVTGSRLNLLGAALTASQGSVTKEEVDLRPIYRIGQLYETVPGLVVTVHSGEGKANQYLLRGFNLDHGTDFASFIDGMPINRPTNTHGQGYSDQNFLMAQVVDGLDFTKGPYYANIGDFGAVGSTHVRLVNDLPDQIAVSAGTMGDQDLFAGGTYHFDPDDRIWAALDLGHLDGPWSPPQDFRKVVAAARYSHGTDADGYSLTAMYYHGTGRLTTDQSVYAVQDGLIGRYGTLDPSDRSRSERLSLSSHFGKTLDDWKLSADAYVIHSRMTLWNDFTHYLFDPVEGDQEQQDETRTTGGINLAATYTKTVFGFDTRTTVGLQERYDTEYIDRRHTRERQPLGYCELANADGTAATPYAAVGMACAADRVQLNDLGLYIRTIVHWLPWLRTEVGLREEAYSAHDRSLTTGFDGSASQSLLQLKGSLIFGPFYQTEFYLSAGKGFHSDDVRGVFGTMPEEGIPATAGRTPLMSPAVGEEIGLRTNLIPKVQVQVAVFQEDFDSELAYDADQGEDAPSAPSRRQGVELSGQYHPFRWLEFSTDLAWSRARYRGSAATFAEFGLDQPYIANAPSFIGGFGVLVDNLGPWFGGLQWRDLGPYPIVDGEKDPRDKGYSEVNLDVGYKVSPRLKLEANVFNLFDTRANASAYDYTSRLVPDGPVVDGFQVHPLEPISARFSLTYYF